MKALHLVRGLLICASVSPVFTGCAGSNEYGSAAAGLAVAVAATGAHRAATGDCWGRCSVGYACNLKSGFCEPSECRPACGPGTQCTLTPTGASCAITPHPFFNPMYNAATYASGEATADPTVVPPDPAVVPPAARALTPDRSSTGQVQIARGNPGSEQDQGSPPLPQVIAAPTSASTTSPNPE